MFVYAGVATYKSADCVRWWRDLVSLSLSFSVVQQWAMMLTFLSSPLCVSVVHSCDYPDAWDWISRLAVEIPGGRDGISHIFMIPLLPLRWIHLSMNAEEECIKSIWCGMLFKCIQGVIHSIEWKIQLISINSALKFLIVVQSVLVFL